MILLTAAAISDADRLHHFLEGKDAGATTRAMQAILTKLELIERMPGLGRKTKSPLIREVEARFGRWSYIVRYTIRDTDGALIVLRIWHGREKRS
jgi:plasmid stabilization system protein ParE